MDKIKQLIKELNMASDAYYNTGNTIMSDAEFDLKLEELRKLEEETGIVMSNSPTHKVGAKILSELPEVTHSHPMLSLAKVHSEKEIVDWAKGEKLIAMIKADGLTCSLKYIDGEFISGETRGDGLKGVDVTEHIKHFTNIPMHINKSGTYVVDGEAIIYTDDFEEINKSKEYKNPRNLAAGTLNVLDTKLVNKRRLSFVLWDVIEGSDQESLFEKLREAERLGFDVIPHWYPFNQSIDELNIEIMNYAKLVNIPADGVVWKINKCEKYFARGKTDHHFSGGVAWKPSNIEEETELLNIEWSLGKTGILTPVAYFKSVEIDGTNVERASLHNLSIMKDLLGEYPYLYEDIKVTKANMIIPMVTWGDKDSATMPHDHSFDIPCICPVCEGDTKIIKDNDSEVLMCMNPNCEGKLLGKLSHFCGKHAMDIADMSEATLKFLIAKGWVKSFEDLYHLDQYAEEWRLSPGYGPTSVKNLLSAIENSKNTSLEKFICGLSIPGIGKSTSKDIAAFCKMDANKFIEIMNDTPYRFTSIDGFGVTMADAMKSWWVNNNEMVINLSNELSFKIVDNKGQKETSLRGKIFVITGKLTTFPNRSSLVEKIETLGGKVSGAVSSKTSFLICNEESSSSKCKKAKDLGIQIITEEDFVKKFI